MACSASTVTPSAVASTRTTSVVGGGQQQHPGRIGAQHVFGGAGCPAVVVFQVGRQREPGGALAGGQRLEQVGPRSGHDQRGNRGRGDRAGHHRSGGLVDHRAEVLDGAARSTAFLGQGHAEDAQLGQARVWRAPRLRVALLDVAGGLHGTGARGPATNQFTRGELLVGDGR